jgi:hypothetical protein
VLSCGGQRKRSMKQFARGHRGEIITGHIARSARPLPYDPSPTAQQPRSTTSDDAAGSVG